MTKAEIATLSGYALAVCAERIDADNWIAVTPLLGGHSICS